MDEPTPDSKATQQLLDRAGDGNPAALSELLARHRPAMRELVRTHLDLRLAARIDPSDVVQDAQMDLVRRLGDFLDRRPMPFHVWARKTAYERLLDSRRHHLGRAKRSVRRERPMPDRSSLLVARPLLSREPSPSQMAAANEFEAKVSRAVAGLPDDDREVLLMRHADGLPFPDAAALLGITPAAARKRFGRALIRLQAALAAEGLLGGGLEMTSELTAAPPVMGMESVIGEVADEFLRRQERGERPDPGGVRRQIPGCGCTDPRCAPIASIDRIGRRAQ